MFEILRKDITWHVPGSSPLSGDYKGHAEVGKFFATLATQPAAPGA